MPDPLSVVLAGRAVASVVKVLAEKATGGVLTKVHEIPKRTLTRPAMARPCATCD